MTKELAHLILTISFVQSPVLAQNKYNFLKFSSRLSFLFLQQDAMLQLISSIPRLPVENAPPIQDQCNVSNTVLSCSGFLIVNGLSVIIIYILPLSLCFE